MCDDKDTYKAILGDVQQGVLLAIYVRNLQMAKYWMLIRWQVFYPCDAM